MSDIGQDGTRCTWNCARSQVVQHDSPRIFLERLIIFESNLNAIKPIVCANQIVPSSTYINFSYREMPAYKGYMYLYLYTVNDLSLKGFFVLTHDPSYRVP